ncbi:AAA family ATPase [Mariprofundus ferrooxydans]|uniref:AAA family ATPase n=1 Tax=Mariprofundus ferrooxydans TaxID=314344 RepID=UPI0003677482|nr:AAA family ATPase [Mariprofundus ferrooxydans]
MFKHVDQWEKDIFFRNRMYDSTIDACTQYMTTKFEMIQSVMSEVESAQITPKRADLIVSEVVRRELLHILKHHRREVENIQSAIGLIEQHQNDAKSSEDGALRKSTPSKNSIKIITDCEEFNRAARRFTNSDHQAIRKSLLDAGRIGPYANLSMLPKNYRAKLDQLRALFPNFLDVINEIERQLIVSSYGSRAFRLPTPILLVGTAGIGKTAFINAVSESLGVKTHRFTCSDQNASFSLTGLASGYATAQPGDIYKLVVEERHANPIVLLDELDKAGGSSEEKYGVESAFYSLLEPLSSRRYKDVCVGIEFDASHISYIATANDVDAISAPIRSRLQIIGVEAPSADQSRTICQSLYASLIRDHGLQKKFNAELDRETIDALVGSDGSVRDLKKRVMAGIGNAMLATVSTGKKLRVTATDIPPKANFERQRMGFIHGQ